MTSIWSSSTSVLNPPPDQLLIRRLKKRKLQLKDRIALLERDAGS